MLHLKMITYELHVREQRKESRTGAFNALPRENTTPSPVPTTKEPSLQDALTALQQEMKELRNQMQRGNSPKTTAPPWVPEYTSDGRPICSFCQEAGHIRRNCMKRKQRRQQRQRDQQERQQRRQNRYCEYHHRYGHSTANCRQKGDADTQVSQKPVAGVQIPTEVPAQGTDRQDFQ